MNYSNIYYYEKVCIQFNSDYLTRITSVSLRLILVEEYLRVDFNKKLYQEKGTKYNKIVIANTTVSLQQICCSEREPEPRPKVKSRE